jgi:predicted DNA-binding transcriptional regulator AlpA
MPTRLLDRAGLRAKGITWNPSTLWRKTVSGEFPKALILGNRNMWIEAEIDQYIEGLIAKRDEHNVKEAAA